MTHIITYMYTVRIMLIYLEGVLLNFYNNFVGPTTIFTLLSWFLRGFIIRYYYDALGPIFNIIHVTFWYRMNVCVFVSGIISWRAILVCSGFCSNRTGQTDFFKDNQCYMKYEENLPWFSARNKCLETGCDLASISQLSLLDGMLDFSGSWVGLRTSQWNWQNAGRCYYDQMWQPC